MSLFAKRLWHTHKKKAIKRKLSFQNLLPCVCAIFFDILIQHTLSLFLLSFQNVIQAMRSTQGSIKPIYISIGHRISLQTATAIVQMTCKYRIPEPIRQVWNNFLFERMWYLLYIYIYHHIHNWPVEFKEKHEPEHIKWSIYTFLTYKVLYHLLGYY